MPSFAPKIRVEVYVPIRYEPAYQDTLTWLDAEVFGHNEPALRLHRKLGFAEVGRVSDMYRIEGAPVDDIRLTLKLRNS